MAFYIVNKTSQNNANPGLMNKIHDYATSEVEVEVIFEIKEIFKGRLCSVLESKINGLQGLFWKGSGVL